MNFKVGDEIIVFNSKSTYTKCIDNKIAKIIKINNDSIVYVINDEVEAKYTSQGFSVMIEHIRKVTKLDRALS